MASASQDPFLTELPTEIASTIQAAHIRSNPDPVLDMAPGTAADDKEILDEKYDYDAPQNNAAEQLDDIDDDDEDIPYNVLKRPRRQRQALPPLPDLRFEQSYLKSIAAADTWWKIALITTRDQVIMPLAQGIIYNLLLCGWQEWNRNAKVHGNSVGARVRRWWYGVNNWTVPNNGQHRHYRR
ncbi:hypothetical protein LLEC1_00224 [Akanthomyces lecanii]|uniref:DUF1770 domain-containing protein n=1 Tax=Cordyceps confragosa TaxID=2714763 RepID=A0A179IDJ5_CORDF|nr:hypothetical protein LLEC1_00224 [Akanthomyces lecanii]